MHSIFSQRNFMNALSSHPVNKHSNFPKIYIKWKVLLDTVLSIMTLVNKTTTLHIEVSTLDLFSLVNRINENAEHLLH